MSISGAHPARFTLITAPRSKSGVDWRAVSRAAGRDAKRLLLPRGWEPPADSGICRFDPARFLRAVLANSAISLLERAARRGARLPVALFDPDAACTALLPRLLACAEEVYVVTRRPDEADRQSEALLERMGAAPIVCTDPACTERCPVAVAPFGAAGFGFLPCYPLTFSPDPDGYRVESDSLPFPELAEITPPGVRPAELAAALWQTGQRRELAGSIPQYYTRFDKRFQVNPLIRRICTLDRRSSNYYNETIVI